MTLLLMFLIVSPSLSLSRSLALRIALSAAELTYFYARHIQDQTVVRAAQLGDLCFKRFNGDVVDLALGRDGDAALDRAFRILCFTKSGISDRSQKRLSLYAVSFSPVQQQVACILLRFVLY